MPWYCRVFGLSFRMDAPHEGGLGKLLADDEWGLIIVLHRHDSNERERFVETRRGLDHVGMMVPDRSDLVRWQSSSGGQRRRANCRRESTPYAIADSRRVLRFDTGFRDPDNIQLELVSPPLPEVPT
jgi:glyoxylase I family protein